MATSDSIKPDVYLADFQGRFLRAVWYGRRSLRETFWKWHVGTTVLGVLVSALGAYLSATFDQMFPLFVIVVLWWPVNVWSAVGLWRSASAESGLWAEIAKAYTILMTTIVAFRLGQIVVFGDSPFGSF